MKCPKCGQLLPEDSEYCQYCGICISEYEESIEPISVQHSDIESENSYINAQTSVTTNDENNILLSGQSTKQSTKTEKRVDNNVSSPPPKACGNKKLFCKKCGGEIDFETRKCKSCGKQYFRAKIIFPVFFLSIVMIALVGLNVYQYIRNLRIEANIQILEQTITEKDYRTSNLENELIQKNTTITSQRTTITDLKNQISDLEDKAGYYDEICKALSNSNLGYATNNFHSSESVIVVSKTQSNRKFTLTANWSNGGTVSVSYSPRLPSARVSFDNDNWTTSTTMTITPRSEGITTVTFSNNVDLKEFKMVIIVTD